MGDVGDAFNALHNHYKALKVEHGVDCPGCKRVQPKRIPTVLLPGHKCKVCGYRDPRARIDEGWREPCK